MAAILEHSVLTQLQVGGVKPDLVYSLGIAAAMVLGFGEGMVWAFVGGLMLDMLLPERPIGSTSLALLIVFGVALLVARATHPPRLSIIALTTFLLSFMYQALSLILLALTAGVAISGVPFFSFLAIAILDAAIAVIAAAIMRALVLRFGPAERADW